MRLPFLLIYQMQFQFSPKPVWYKQLFDRQKAKKIPGTRKTGDL